MSLSRILHLLSLVLGIVAVLFVGGWIYEKFSSAFTPQSTYGALMQTNQSFTQGEQQLFSVASTSQEERRSASLAVESYRAALAAAKSPAEEAGIKYKLAYATDITGDYVGAIKLFKEIAADTSYPAELRAYSVKYMVTMLHRIGDPKIRNEIFKDEPYKSMAVSAGIPHYRSLSVRHVNEYAVSLYPLAVPELNIAIWYANDIKTLQSTSTLQAKNDWQEIQQRLQAANTDIARTQNDATTQLTVANDYELKAILYGKLASVGLVSTQEAETAFQQAFDFLSRISLRDSGFRYQYAMYLSYFRDPDVAKIQQILAPYVSDPAYAARFFQTERNNWMGQKPDLVRMANLDPDFKGFLIKMGWTANDFSSVSS